MHYAMLVAAKDADDARKILEPYREEDGTADDLFWDWYVFGGRWHGQLISSTGFGEERTHDTMYEHNPETNSASPASLTAACIKGGPNYPPFRVTDRNGTLCREKFQNTPFREIEGMQETYLSPGPQNRYRVLAYNPSIWESRVSEFLREAEDAGDTIFLVDYHT